MEWNGMDLTWTMEWNGMEWNGWNDQQILVMSRPVAARL